MSLWNPRPDPARLDGHPDRPDGDEARKNLMASVQQALRPVSPPGYVRPQGRVLRGHTGRLCDGVAGGVDGVGPAGEECRGSFVEFCTICNVYEERTERRSGHEEMLGRDKAEWRGHLCHTAVGSPYVGHAPPPPRTEENTRSQWCSSTALHTSVRLPASVLQVSPGFLTENLQTASKADRSSWCTRSTWHDLPDPRLNPLSFARSPPRLPTATRVPACNDDAPGSLVIVAACDKTRPCDCRCSVITAVHLPATSTQPCKSVPPSTLLHSYKHRLTHEVFTGREAPGTEWDKTTCGDNTCLFHACL